MNACIISNNEKGELNQNKVKYLYKNINSKYILQKICDNLQIIKLLKFVKYNKTIKEKLDLTLNDYKEHSFIEIEIIPIIGNTGQFININEKDELYYHIYFNNNKEEEKKYEINDNDSINKVNIRISHQVTSFASLFWDCTIIELINFKTFYRSNIVDMSQMFESDVFSMLIIKKYHIC